MDVQGFLQLVPTLTDLELAVLLSLTAKEHCLVCSDDELTDDLVAELALIVSESFRLSHTVLSIENFKTIELFVDAILDENCESEIEEIDFDDIDDDFENPFAPHSRMNRSRFGSHQIVDKNKLDVRKVVNVIIAPDFNLAPKDVQIQALELIRRGRVYSRTTLHRVPKTFLFLPVTRTSTRRVRFIDHLNDKIFISHFHQAEDGFPNLEDLDNSAMSDDYGSISTRAKSVISRGTSKKIGGVRIRKASINQLRTSGNAVTLTPEIRRYLHDIVVFLRMERGVDGGVTPNATNQFVALTKYLAPLHNLDFVTPSLVALAAKKIYPHRIIIATPERERSIQYGTDLQTAKELLEDITPESVIDSVLNTVACPL